MKISDLKAILNSYPDDAQVFLVAKSRTKQYDDVDAKEHKVFNDEGDWVRASAKEPGAPALVLVAA
ncbi:MAG: hypothetical protein V4713_03825 [Pseudomonadota bacterium]